MAKIFSVELLGYRDLMGRYAERSEALLGFMRERARQLGRDMVATLRDEAAEDTGEFKKGIRYRTTVIGDTVRLTFYVGGAHAFLLDIFMHGTRKDYLIPTGGAAEQLAKGYPLHWVDEYGVHHYAWEVVHPGLEPDRFDQRAIERMQPGFEEALSQTARSVIWLQ